MLIENGFTRVVGLDPSKLLLLAAKARLVDCFYPVLAVSENVPLRENCMGGAITCFSLRDVRNRAQSISEFNRVLKDDARLEIVDVGKPDSALSRKAIGIYIALVMPILARAFIGGRDRRNPFRMIVPTFRQLSTNHQLANLVERTLGVSTLHEFLFGGLIIVEAQRPK